MSKIITPRLPEQRLVTRIEEIERQLEELRTKQNAGADIISTTTSNTLVSQSSIDLTTTLQDVPDTEVTEVLSVDSTVFFSAHFELFNKADVHTSHLAFGVIDIDSTSYGSARLQWGTAHSGESMRASVALNRVVDLDAGSHTFKLQAQVSAGTVGSCSIDSGYFYMIFRQATT